MHLEDEDEFWLRWNFGFKCGEKFVKNLCVGLNLNLKILRFESSCKSTFRFAIDRYEARRGSSFELKMKQLENFVIFNKARDFPPFWMLDLNRFKVRNSRSTW